jgi:threonine synthase
MILVSTTRIAPPVTFEEALLRGLAPDGGLYLPTVIPGVEPKALASWRGLPIGEVAVRVVSHLVGDEFDRDTLERLTREAFDFPAPTVPIADGLSVLELFHGPTLAFKDFGARFLARVFGTLLGERGGHATILVATSGDTGSAVAQGFHGVPRVRVVVLYPAGKVSPFQEAQMATLGGNVTALRVPGTFDDCQRLVKQAFLDERLAGLGLSSANSINIGRLLPQAVYYVASWLAAGGDEAGEVVFAVPSGNLGNLTAGVIAQRLGVPVGRFIAATNVNAVLPDYLQTGTYSARAARPTLSNAMDVGDPSNFPRLSQIHAEALDALRANVVGISIGEDETRRTIREVYGESGYLLDPHSAVGVAAARRARAEMGERRPLIALATAHPAKFGDVIRQELGFDPEMPEAWRDWRTREVRAVDLPDLTYPAFRESLTGMAE